METLTHTQTIHEKIEQRRIQMIYHSHAYYHYDITFVTDAQFDTWARELVKLQADHPQESAETRYAEQFANWDATTGFHLIDIEVQKYTTKIYHSIKYLMYDKPDKVTTEMLGFVDSVDRGII